ncbi:MAG TPA: hypothetical protein VMX36_00100 [Sedimentisphaerales bacterium]|nr:hypothetical protein [Sedimentisphaerales bacterium]
MSFSLFTMVCILFIAGEPDIGYTRTVQRPDGKLVTIYYWLDEPRTERYIAATIFSAPLSPLIPR